MKGYKRWFLLTSFLLSMMLNIGFNVIFLALLIPVAVLVEGSSDFGIATGIFGFVIAILFSLIMLLAIAFQAAFVTANYLEVRELKEPFDEESMANVFS